jgi:uncharacterized membrane protein YgdD (TMEM256/DUF423 family)
MGKNWIATGAFLAAVSVMAGALGAHALRGQISENLLDSYRTGVQYHTVHAIALLAVGILARVFPARNFAAAGWLFSAGILFFSGSIYLLSTRELSGWNVSFLGLVTPIGGLLFMAGWIVLAVKVLRS